MQDKDRSEIGEIEMRIEQLLVDLSAEIEKIGDKVADWDEWKFDIERRFERLEDEIVNAAQREELLRTLSEKRKQKLDEIREQLTALREASKKL